MVNKLILGTVQFGLNYGINNNSGKVSTEEVDRILDLAFENSISILDTAEAYGNSIEIIGDYHSRRDARFEIISKFKFEKNQNLDFLQLVKQSLEKMHVAQLFGYMYHSFNDFNQNKDSLVALKKLKKQGLIKHIGVSVYNNSEIEAILDIDEIEIIQLPYNLLDNRSQRGDIIAKAKLRGKIIHTRSAFLQGLFFKPTSNLNSFLQPLKKELEIINETSSQHNIGIADLALSYALGNSDIDGVLIGVDNVAQLETNLLAANAQLTNNLELQIDDISVNNQSLLNPSNWK